MPALARHGVLAGLLALIPAVVELLSEAEPSERSVVLGLLGILLVVAAGSAGLLLAGADE